MNGRIEHTPEAMARANAMIDALAASALPYPEYLLTTMPTDPASPEMTARIKKLGRLTVNLNALERASLCEKMFKHSKGLPRIPAREVFNAGYKEAREEQAKAANTNAGEGPASVRPRSPTDPEKMKGHVFQEDGRIFRENALGIKERVSDFALEPTHLIRARDRGQDWIRCRVIEPYSGIDAGMPEAPKTQIVEKEWVIPPEAWVSPRAFRAALPNHLCNSSMGEDEISGLRECLKRDYGLRDLPLLKATPIIGRHTLSPGQVRFVLPAGTLSADQGFLEEPDLVFLPDGGSSIQHRLPTRKDARPETDSPELRALAKDVLPDLLSLHHPESVAALVGWFFASLLTPELRLHLAGVPILNLFASQASGKSSLIGRILWPLFTGAHAGELMGCASTPWAMIKDFTSTNAVALAFDELRRDMQDGNQERFYRLLRRSYTGETEARGRADQGMNSYPLSAPMIVSGEIRIEGDEALVSRCLFVGLDANWLTKNPASKAAYDRLRVLPLHTLGPFLQRWSLRLDADALATEGYTRVGAALVRIGRDRIPARARSNLVWMTVGLIMYERLAEELGAELPNVGFKGTLHRCLAESFNEDPETLTKSTEGRVRSNVDNFLVDAAVLAGLSLLKEGIHYAWVGDELRLWLDGIFHVWSTARKSQGSSPPPVTVTALKRRAAEMKEAGGSYVIDVGRETPMEGDGRRHRCLSIDPTKISSSLGVDIDAFQKNELKSHGGKRTLSPEELLSRWGKTPHGDPS